MSTSGPNKCFFVDSKFAYILCVASFLPRTFAAVLYLNFPRDCHTAVIEVAHVKVQFPRGRLSSMPSPQPLISYGSLIYSHNFHIAIAKHSVGVGMRFQRVLFIPLCSSNIDPDAATETRLSTEATSIGPECSACCVVAQNIRKNALISFGVICHRPVVRRSRT
jgi:hypothetical protein